MARKPHQPFTTDYAVLLGETLAESLEASGMSQTELALRMGLARKMVSGILHGTAPFTTGIALRLEGVTVITCILIF